MPNFDVTVIGAGLAGLHTAELLGRAGCRVLLTDRKARTDQGIHTTGIFVRKTLEDFDLPKDCLGPAIRHVNVYSPKRRALHLISPYDEFRVGRMALLYDRLLNRCIRAGVEWLPSARYEGHTSVNDKLFVRLNRNGSTDLVETRYIVGADGSASRVAESLQLDRNNEWLVGVEEVFQGMPLEGQPALHVFVEPQLAPGYIAWVVHDGHEIHLGVGGYAYRFDPALSLNRFRQTLAEKFDFHRARLVERRGGRIPVNGILRRLANERGLLVGDAAGAVSPLTAGGFDGCLRLSTLAAEVIQQFLTSGDPHVLQTYSGESFRSRFVSRLWMRRIASQVTQPALIEFACAVLRLPLLKSFTWHVFFGRGSFPDVQSAPQRMMPRLASLERS